MQKRSYYTCKKKSIEEFGIATDSSLIKSTKTKQKAFLKAIRELKKLKYIDYLLLVKKAQAIVLRDKWLIKKRNPPFNTKAWMKKATNARKKLAEKPSKREEETKAKYVKLSEMMK